MSTQVFPSLPLIAWPVKRTHEWSDNMKAAISGKETGISNWTYPRIHFELTYAGAGALRQGTRGLNVFSEWAQLAGFFDARTGRVDPFLYTADDDNQVTGQEIGTGDGTTTSFQLLRTLGGFIAPVFAPNVVSNVYLNAVAQSPSSYSVAPWNGNTTGGSGILTFTAAPAAGKVITADFTYYWACRFEDMKLDFEKTMATLWSAKSVKFYTVK